MASFLRTQGSRIIDTNGVPFRIKGVSWFGLETERRCPCGLNERPLADILQQIRSLGFNTVRLPFSSAALFEPNPPESRYLLENPQLQTLTPLQLMDEFIAQAKLADLRVILCRHRITVGNGPEDNGKWYRLPEWSYQQFLSDWRVLAERYAGDPTVIGADLHNEPQFYRNSISNQIEMAPDVDWDGPAAGPGQHGWAAAATEAGEQIMTKNSDWLIFVQGMGRYANEYYWFGGNLRGAASNPVVLSVPNRVVYSPHDYPPSVYLQPFQRPEAGYPGNMEGIFESFWGYLSQNQFAPIVIGEMGSYLDGDRTTPSVNDWGWAKAIVSYLSARPEMGFIWWSWNPESHDTGGVLDGGWKTPRPEVLELLAPLL